MSVVGYRTTSFPGFYLSSSGQELRWSVDDPDQAAAVYRSRAAAGLQDRALVVANPLAPTEQLDPDLHDRVLTAALTQVQQRGITGVNVRPFLLDYFHRETQGRGLAVTCASSRTTRAWPHASQWRCRGEPAGGRGGGPGHRRPGPAVRTAHGRQRHARRYPDRRRG